MPLARNLAARQAMVHAVYPAMTIFSFGDPKHQSERSDHNADSRGIWHALDIMTRTDTSYAAAAPIILAWLLGDVTDLQYVIHDDRIYGRNEANGWKGAPYQPNNPNRDRHKDHIHVSSKHGSTGKNAATGTGYDLVAEAYIPPVSLIDFMEGDMPTADEIAKAIMEYTLPDKGTVAQLLVQLRARTNTEVNIQNPQMIKDLDKIAAQTAPVAPPTPSVATPHSPTSKLGE
jgi:hypothetical protein